jgi:hypothetical protein
MSYQAYLNTGGAPRGTPGYDAASVADPDLHRVVPMMLLISVVGIFTLTGLRRLMILEWRVRARARRACGAAGFFLTGGGELVGVCA